MSKKNSLLAGAVLGSLAAGAALYFMKTENGQAVKARTKEQLTKLKENAVQFMEENHIVPSDIIKEKIQEIFVRSNDRTLPADASETVILSAPDRVQKEFTQIENEIRHLEKNWQQPNQQAE